MGNILIKSWIDTVFEYRNKDYGAYTLRYSYPHILTVSALIVIVVFLSSMLLSSQSSKNKNIQVKTTKKVFIDYSQLAPPPPIEKTVTPKTVVVQEKIQKYVAPQITTEEVKEEEELPTIDEVNQNLNATGPNTEGVGDAEVQVAEPSPPPEPEPVLVDKLPEFPGGDKALEKWLADNLKYPAAASRMGIEGKVVVEFTVEPDGSLSGISIVQSLHRLCDNEALRLVRAMPAWNPGELQGVKVASKLKLPIPFVIRG
jgi:periplasmic protein TonB